MKARKEKQKNDGFTKMLPEYTPPEYRPNSARLHPEFESDNAGWKKSLCNIKNYTII